MKISLLLILSIFMVSIVSASGLNIPLNTLEINKTSQIDQYFNITVINQESFKFYNISSQNSVISFDKFSLESGQNKTIQVKVVTNSDFNGEVKIVSDYFAELGSSSKTENVVISSNGLDICNLDLVVGDTIIWQNILLGEVKIKNLDSNQYITTVAGSSNYSNIFTEALEFDYQIFKTGLPFSDICHLNIRPTTGFIHSSEYDALLNLNIKISYEPTTISATFPTNSYILNYNGQAEDIFTIKNTGNKPAKNVKITGEWFEFNTNNFDLQIGESKNIGYKVKPLVYQSEQTNKTHNKSITIEGNFGTISKQVDIFINYKDLSGAYANSSYDKEYLQNLVNFFCSVYPDDCPRTVVFGNETEKNVTFTINEETYKQGILEEDSFREEMRSILRLHSEELANMGNSSDYYLNNSNNTRTAVENLSNKTDNLLGTIIFGALIFIVLLIVLALVVLMFSQRGKLKLRNMFHKGEMAS